MKDYRVTIEIDVAADNHTQAAQLGWRYLKESCVEPICDVCDEDGDIERIDLQEELENA